MIFKTIISFLSPPLWRGGKSRRDATLPRTSYTVQVLTVGFNLRTRSVAHAPQVPQGRYLWQVQSVVPGQFAINNVFMSYKYMSKTLFLKSTLSSRNVPLSFALIPLFQYP